MDAIERDIADAEGVALVEAPWMQGKDYGANIQGTPSQTRAI